MTERKRKRLRKPKPFQWVTRFTHSGEMYHHVSLGLSHKMSATPTPELFKKLALFTLACRLRSPRRRSRDLFPVQRQTQVMYRRSDLVTDLIPFTISLWSRYVKSLVFEAFHQRDGGQRVVRLRGRSLRRSFLPGCFKRATMAPAYTHEHVPPDQIALPQTAGMRCGCSGLLAWDLRA
jgi:hypothetical protein